MKVFQPVPLRASSAPLPGEEIFNNSRPTSFDEDHVTWSGYYCECIEILQGAQRALTDPAEREAFWGKVGSWFKSLNRKYEKLEGTPSYDNGSMSDEDWKGCVKQALESTINSYYQIELDVSQLSPQDAALINQCLQQDFAVLISLGQSLGLEFIVQGELAQAEGAQVSSQEAASARPASSMDSDGAEGAFDSSLRNAR